VNHRHILDVQSWSRRPSRSRPLPSRPSRSKGSRPFRGRRTTLYPRLQAGAIRRLAINAIASGTRRLSIGLLSSRSYGGGRAAIGHRFAGVNQRSYKCQDPTFLNSPYRPAGPLIAIKWRLLTRTPPPTVSRSSVDTEGSSSGVVGQRLWMAALRHRRKCYSRSQTNFTDFTARVPRRNITGCVAAARVGAPTEKDNSTLG
jgi:hypothetical protein